MRVSATRPTLPSPRPTHRPSGVPSCANGAFQNDMVRGQWGWDGFFVSDVRALVSWLPLPLLLLQDRFPLLAVRRDLLHLPGPPLYGQRARGGGRGG